MDIAVPARITVDAADRLASPPSSARVCDACGDAVAGTHAWRVAYTDRSTGVHAVVDVCPECAFSLTAVSSLA